MLDAVVEVGSVGFSVGGVVGAVALPPPLEEPPEDEPSEEDEPEPLPPSLEPEEEPSLFSVAFVVASVAVVAAVVVASVAVAEVVAVGVAFAFDSVVVELVVIEDESEGATVSPGSIGVLLTGVSHMVKAIVVTSAVTTAIMINVSLVRFIAKTFL